MITEFAVRSDRAELIIGTKDASRTILIIQGTPVAVCFYNKQPVFPFSFYLSSELEPKIKQEALAWIGGCLCGTMSQQFFDDLMFVK